MNDRLAELQDVPAWAQENEEPSNGGAGGGGDDGDIEMGQKKQQTKKQKTTANDESDFPGWADEGETSNGNTTDAPSQPEHMKQFFDDVEFIKSDISAVTDATEQIITLKDRAVLATAIGLAVSCGLSVGL